MRQVASGFAIGSFSVTVFAVPFLMLALGMVPTYSAALASLVERAQVEQYRNQLVQPVAAFIGQCLSPHGS